MIQLPSLRRRHQNYWKIATLVLLVVIILASIFLSVYWYIFGTRNPLSSNNSRQNNVYVAPQFRLSHVIINGFSK